MDLEAPVDAWYVWVGVAVVSVAVAGIALALPSGPPPDANAAANTIDGVAGSPYEATGRTPHDGTEVRIEGPRVSLRNDHGTTHATVAYGPVVPVMGNDRLEALAAGAPFESVYASELADDHVDAGAVFLADVEDALEANEGEWRQADGELAVRHLGVEPQDPEPVPYATVSMIVSELDGESTETGESGNFVTEVTFQYEGNRRTDATLGIIGYTPGEYRTETVDVTVTPTTDTHTLSLSEAWFHNYVDGEFAEMDATVGDPLEDSCTAPISNTSVGATATCSFGEPGAIDPTEAGDVAARLEWISLDGETGAYHVTLVDA